MWTPVDDRILGKLMICQIRFLQEEGWTRAGYAPPPPNPPLTGPISNDDGLG